MRIDILMLFLLPFLAAIGAWFSRQLKSGRKGFFFLIPLNAVLTSTTWAIIANTTKMSLSVASAIFDIICSLSYFFAFVLMGETCTLWQGIGVFFAVVALVLLSL